MLDVEHYDDAMTTAPRSLPTFSAGVAARWTVRRGAGLTDTRDVTVLRACSREAGCTVVETSPGIERHARTVDLEAR